MSGPRDLSELWKLLRNARLESLAPQLVGLGVYDLNDITRRAEDLIAEGVTQAQLEQLLASNAPREEPLPSTRWDHATVRPSNQRASFTLALQAAQPNNRKRSLDQLDADILARTTQPAQASRIRTYRSLCAA